MRERLFPETRLFDPGYYSRENALSPFWARHPFVHYILRGRRQGAETHPLLAAGWYRQKNPDVDFRKFTPAAHFLSCGWREGRNPHPLFDGEWYLGHYPDVKAAGHNPLLHYLAAGEAEGRNPHPLFDVHWYRREAKLAFTAGALAHYLAQPGTASPHPLWDAVYFQQQAGSESLPGLQHYLTDDSLWGISPHPLFNVGYYRQQTQAIGDEMAMAPLDHFVRFGGKRRYRPHRLFDIEWYLSRNADLRHSSANPLVHYLSSGEQEGRSPHPLFDAEWYRQQLQHKQGIRLERGLLAHYALHSCPAADPSPFWQQAHVDRQVTGRRVFLENYMADKRLWPTLNPNPLFDAAFYSAQVAATGKKMLGSPLRHFCTTGWQQGLDPHPLFDVSWYFRRHPRARQLGHNPLASYFSLESKGAREAHPLWSQEHVNAQTGNTRRVYLSDYIANPALWSLSPHPLFDSAYYRQQLDADGEVLSVAPLQHFMERGWKEKRNPHRLFDTGWYLKAHADVRNSNANPLVHFVLFGDMGDRDPHPLVDLYWYKSQLSRAGKAVTGKFMEYFLAHEEGQGPHVCPLWDQAFVDRQARGRARVTLADYIHDPRLWHLNPHPVFDAKYYQLQLKALRKTLSCPPIQHFLREGWKLGLNPHPLFDTRWYWEKHTDVRDLRCNPFLHYRQCGEEEGRTPHPLFDVLWYRRQLEESGQAAGDGPLAHYLSQGRRAFSPHPAWDQDWIDAQAGRHIRLPEYLRNRALWAISPHRLFDPAWYVRQAEARGGCGNCSPMEHFFREGWKQGHDPHPLFETAWYLGSNVDVSESGVNPLCHYVISGEESGLDPHPLFDVGWYRKGLSEAGIRPGRGLLEHYLDGSTPAISPHPLWDPAYLAEQTGSTAISLVDYLLQEEHWGLNPHPLFDAGYYGKQVFDMGVAPLLHCLKNTDLSVNPSIYFHVRWYMGRNSYLSEFRGKAGIPLMHFLLKGSRQGENPHPFFESKWYAENYLNWDRISVPPIVHYITTGYKQGCNPNPSFDSAQYRKRHRIPQEFDPLKWFLQRTPVDLPPKRNRLADAFVCVPVPARAAGHFEYKAPAKRYAMLFTPRSGSSLLTDLVTALGVLGRPTEWFNPDLVLRTRNGLPGGALTLRDYIRALLTLRSSPNGVFGVQMVWSHLESLIECGGLDLLLAADDAFFLHIRKNLVAQAISLFLAAESGYFHSHQAGNARFLPAYDVQAIATAIDELLKQETGLCGFVSGRQMQQRIHLTCYEDLAADQARFVEAMGAVLGVPCELPAQPAATRQKIGTNINLEYEARFREERRDWLAARMERRRQAFDGIAGVQADMF